MRIVSISFNLRPWPYLFGHVSNTSWTEFTTTRQTFLLSIALPGVRDDLGGSRHGCWIKEWAQFSYFLLRWVSTAQTLWLNKFFCCSLCVTGMSSPSLNGIQLWEEILRIVVLKVGTPDQHPLELSDMHIMGSPLTCGVCNGVGQAGWAWQAIQLAWCFKTWGPLF